MKKNKIFRFSNIAIASTLVVPIIAVVSCEKKTENPVKKSKEKEVEKNLDSKKEIKIKTADNQKQVLNDVKNTSNVIAFIYKELLKALDSSIEKKAKTELEKKALNVLKEGLTPIINSAIKKGNLWKSIDSLSEESANYQEKLKEIRNVLLPNINTMLETYKKFYKTIDPTSKDEDIIKEFNDLSNLDKFFQFKDAFFKLNTEHYLDLARLFEEVYDLVPQEIWQKHSVRLTSTKAIKQFSKFLIQTFNFMTKRQLQTLVMAQAIENPEVLVEKLKDSLKKYNSFIDERKKYNTWPDVIVVSSKTLQPNIKKAKDILTKIDGKKNDKEITIFNDTNKAKNIAMLENIKKSISSIEKLQGGFPKEEKLAKNAEFLRPGYSKIIEDLDKQIIEVAKIKVDSVSGFLDLYKKSPLLNQNARNASNFIRYVGPELQSSTKTLDSIMSTSASTKEKDKEVNSLFDELKNVFKQLITAFGILSNSTAEYYGWLVNQNLTSIYSVAQIVLLQAAIDTLNLDSKDYAVGEVTNKIR